MKRSKAIGRAVERLDTPTLPLGFNTRLMAHVNERARQQRRDFIISSILVAVMVVVMAIVVVFMLMQIDWHDVYHIVMTIPRLGAWGILTISIVALFVVDLYVRRYFRLRKLRREDGNSAQ